MHSLYASSDPKAEGISRDQREGGEQHFCFLMVNFTLNFLTFIREREGGEQHFCFLNGQLHT